MADTEHTRIHFMSDNAKCNALFLQTLQPCLMAYVEQMCHLIAGRGPAHKTVQKTITEPVCITSFVLLCTDNHEDTF